MIRDIYAFRDPTTQQFFYVGGSAYPRERLSAAIGNARAGRPENKDLAMRLLRLLLQGVRPEVVILEADLAEKDWPKAERLWIARLRAEGHPLANKKPGGEGSWHGVPREDRILTYRNFPLTYREYRTLKDLSDARGEEIEDLIREAINGYWIEHERGRRPANPRDDGDDPTGDGGLPGAPAPFAGESPGERTDEGDGC